MASIKLAPGTLSPPACYASEQERFEAFVAKIVATILGGLQWETSSSVPVDLALYWLRRNSDTRPRGPRLYSAADGRWVPWLEVPIIPDSSGGGPNAYTVITGHNLTSAAVQITGRRVLFVAAANNTSASTLSVDGGSAVSIVRHNASALAADDIIEGTLCEVVYNAAGGGRWELQTPVPPPSSTTPTFKTITAAAPPAAGASLDLAHEGSKAPGFVDVRLVCTVSDRGYEVDDELPITDFFYAGLNTGFPAYTVRVSDSQVTLVRSSSATSVFVAPKDAGAAFAVAVDPARWSVKAYCMFTP